MLTQENYSTYILNTVREGILILDNEMRVLSANRSFLTTFKVDSANTIGFLLYDLGNGQWNIPVLRALLEDILPMQTTIHDFEIEHNFEVIGKKTMLLNACKIAEHMDEPPVILLAIEDITERSEMDRKLRASFIFQQQLIDALPMPVFYKDSAGNYLGCNSFFVNFSGQIKKQVIGRSVYEISPKEFADIYNEKDMELLHNPGLQIYESKVIDRDGVTHDVIFHKATFLDPDGSVGGLIGAVIDITERKRAEQALQESEHILRSTLDGLSAHIVLLDALGSILLVNKAWRQFAQQSGLAPALVCEGANYLRVCDEAIGQDADMAIQFAGGIRAVLAGEADTYVLEYPCNTPDKEQWFAGRVSLFAGEGPRRVVVSHQDNTDRWRAEEALRENERRIRTLVQTIPDLIWLKDKNGVYLSCNTMFERFFGACEADILGKTDYDFVSRELADSFRENDLKAMTSAMTTSNEEWITFADDGHRAFLDTIKTPMYDARGTLIGVLGIGRDITNRTAVERIKKALEATVQAIAVTVETRDPYTAGHQRRVADLAFAIATEMNLPADKKDGIRMAAIIHDLGKLSVPAEILTKPTKLSEIEFMLIKTHSQAGYDILKDIEFPWPVARTVLEHHEKINGSGYPNGLTGDKIILEAKVLIVADVVEAMASHRPYRPSLGVDLALEEIEKNRETLYDKAVVDACLRLFREKGFRLDIA